MGGGTWYDNPFFVGAAPGTTWSTAGEASLGHEHNFRSGVFTWSGNGGALYYPEVDGLNQPTYGGAVSLAWSPGRRRTTVNLRQDYQRSNTRSLVTLDPEGLPLPTSGLDNATSYSDIRSEALTKLGVSGRRQPTSIAATTTPG